MKLEKLWKKGTDFLGSKYAILGGAMSWVSEHNLVSAISNAGGFGVIACGSMNPDMLESEIKKTQSKTKKPFGVNLITMHPQLSDLIEVTIKLGVTHVVLAGGLPKAEHIKKLKDHNIKVVCFAPAAVIAKRLIRNGVDAIVIEGMEAGGHIGPVSTSVLAQEILPEFRNIPVFIAGGIGRGEAITQYLRQGAAGCQLGTRFVCAEECIAHENFKNLFIKSNARDATVSVQVDPNFPVIPVRAIENDASKRFMEYQIETIKRYQSGVVSKEEAQLEIEHFWAGALRKAVIDGDVTNGSVMAGQSVGLVKKIQPVQDIIEELVSQARASLNDE
ncbi:MAG: nitronate monooxygenase [Rickettsiales bacterium]